MNSLDRLDPTSITKLRLDPFHFEKAKEKLNSTDQVIQEIKNFKLKVCKPKSSIPLEPLLKNSSDLSYVFLDENRLLKGSSNDSLIDPVYRNWFINQALLLEQMKNADKDTQKQLMLIMLHGYSKSATINKENSQNLGIQVSPVLPQNTRYHRSSENILLLQEVTQAYAEDLGLQAKEIHMIHSPLLREVIARELPHPNLELEIENIEEFEDLIDVILSDTLLGKYPQNRILFDLTKLLSRENVEPREIREKIIPIFEEIVSFKFQMFKSKYPQINEKDIYNRVLTELHLIAFIEHKSQHILFCPEFFTQEQLSEIAFDLNMMIIRNGFRISPDQAKEAWLKIKKPKEILRKLKLPIAKFATQGTKAPRVSESFNQFIKEPVVQKFRNLSPENKTIPYLYILPKALYSLLNGIAEHGKIDKIYKEKGIGDLLQLSYYRMQNAMKEAMLHKDNLIEFNNQIELIHQEIQCILAIAEFYDENSLAQSIINKLTTGNEPIIPSDLEIRNVYLKPSAMHSLFSVISGVEKEKKNNNLSVLILKDSYYESNEIITHARTYTFDILDGDKFDKKNVAKSLKSSKPDSKVAKKTMTSPPPYDLFIYEFHHNISMERQSYRAENILEQVKSLIKARKVANKFTVVIDTTLSLEQSEEVRKFLQDDIIKRLINEGALNIVLLRSAQKFDMLGIDNYYGGITTIINNPKAFHFFNSRMDDKEDQLGGLSYQGLAHLQKYGEMFLDQYRQAIMENTQKLYAQLPKKMISCPRNENPIQVSKIEDSQHVFLDIKFSFYKDAFDAFSMRFNRFVKDEKLPVTSRPSFGFITSNFLNIEGKMLRLNVGLEEEKTIERYAAFFKSMQKEIDKVIQTKSVPYSKRDAYLAKRLLALKVL